MLIIWKFPNNIAGRLFETPDLTFFYKGLGLLCWKSQQQLHCLQGRNEVRWRPGQEASLAPPCSILWSFWKQMYCIEESTCDIVATFRRPPQSFVAPRSYSASGELCPSCTPLVTPLIVSNWLAGCLVSFYARKSTANHELRFVASINAFVRL